MTNSDTGERVLNEKRLIQQRLAQSVPQLTTLVSDVRAALPLNDDIWSGP